MALINYTPLAHLLQPPPQIPNEYVEDYIYFLYDDISSV
jgi:hypothetical protein